MKTPIGLESARNQLASVWFGGALVPFTILVIQSILGKYGNDTQKVFEWFVPSVGPTLSMMLGVIGATALADDQDPRCVKRFFLRISTGISVFYLVVLTLTLLLQPFSGLSGPELYARSKYWLAPLQSLAVAAIAVLFTSQTKSPLTPATGTPAAPAR